MGSPKCQFILNEVICYKWSDFQDQSRTRKIFRFVVHFLLITIITPFYIPFRIFEKIWPKKSSNMYANMRCPWSNRWQRRAQKFIEWVQTLYEDPFRKFANHLISYVVLLCLLFSSTLGGLNTASALGLSRNGKFFLVSRSCVFVYKPLNQIKVHPELLLELT